MLDESRTDSGSSRSGNASPLSNPAASSLALRFALSAASSAVSESSTFPIDLVKTRMQLEAKCGHRHKPGAVSTALGVIRIEGPRGLYRGLGAAVARHIPYTGTRILVYEHLRSRFSSLSPSTSRDSLPIHLKMLSGFISGATGQFVAVPMDLVKVRMQSDGVGGAGKAARYKSVWDGVGKIVKEEGGVKALWKGASPAVQRAALVNLGELATYDTAKTLIIVHVRGGSQPLHDGTPSGRSRHPNDDVWTHVMASICSGFFASLVSTPADVIKTRVMNQLADRPLYTSTLDCLVKSVRSEGWWALYRGFWPTWARLGPWQLVFWVTYERLRVVAGVGEF